MCATFDRWDRRFTYNRWESQNKLYWLRQWARYFNAELRLGVEKVQVCIAPLDVNTLANCSSKGLVTFNERKMDRPRSCLLETLLHEQCHAHVGTGHWHDAVYRGAAANVGLLVDPEGYSRGTIADGPFVRLLRRHGIAVPGGSA
jgi:hypothetical protein